MVRSNYNPDWIPPPGATITDLISRKGGPTLRAVVVDHFGQTDAAKLFTGELPIDPDMAAFLANRVGLSVSFWLERERLYREALRQRDFEKQFLDGLPLDDMRKRTLIKSLNSHAETVAEVVDFFGEEDVQGCLSHIQQLPMTIKQKSSRSIVSLPGSLAVWARAGEIEAGRVECADWDPECLIETLPEIRALTRTEDPKKYLPALKALCQRCGIAFVTLRALSGCSARGVMKFLSPKKAMILLSYRHLSDDQFWFSVFHELAHLLLHANDDTIIDDWDDSTTTKEVEADRFAADTLIPVEYQGELASLRDDRAIIGFARRVGVSRGVVVGQMQHKGIIDHSKFNHLKIYYQWDSNNQIGKKSR